MTDAKLTEIIIYTSTLYDSAETSRVRSELCLNMLRNAASLGIRVILKDAGSNKEFIDKIKEFENVILIQAKPEEKKSMGQDRRDALKKAIDMSQEWKLENPCFFWVEPEKDNLISKENLLAMHGEIQRGSNIVQPARKEHAWQTMPKVQRWFEKRANKRAQEILKEVSGGKHQELLDLWFGPRMLDLEGAKYFLNYNKDGTRMDLWDAVLVPIADAIRDGKKVAGTAVDYEYSETQRSDEEAGETSRLFIRKRLEQYVLILKEMGDKKWKEFFVNSEEEMTKMKELDKTNQPTAEQKQEKDEVKKEILKKFFR